MYRVWGKCGTMTSVSGLIDMFKKARTTVTVSECLGHLSTATSDEKQVQARATTPKNRGRTTKDTVSAPDISECSAHSIVHNILEFQ